MRNVQAAVTVGVDIFETEKLLATPEAYRNQQRQAQSLVTIPTVIYINLVTQPLRDRNNTYLFDVHVTVHRDKFLIIKPTRCTNFSNLFLK